MNPVDIEWRRIGTIALAVGFLIIFAGVLVTTVPQVAGADHSFVVLSDSMSPAIDAGAVVIVSDVPADQINHGDVITYVDSESPAESTRVTHRVVDVETKNGERQFRTQGDANEAPDPGAVKANTVIGVVQFHIPYFGYFIEFAGSNGGIVTLVVVPAILLAGSEVWSLYSDATKEEGEAS